MDEPSNTLRQRHPLTWTFHRNTSRWAHNALTAAGNLPPQAPNEYLERVSFELPDPSLPRAEFGTLVRERLSCRRFKCQAIALAALSDLLFAGYGVLGCGVYGRLELLERPVPSGGGLYPLELFVLVQDVESLEPGIYHYAVVSHRLEQIREVLVPKPLRDYLFMGQSRLAEAPAHIVIVGVPERSLGKYGDRGYRYLLLEAGHVAQNLNLAAIARGLASCNVGGFFDQDLSALLGLDPERDFPVYAVAVGHPEAGDREHLRSVDE